MESTKKTGRDWPSLKFARIDVTSPQEVAEYIMWLRP
jgi:hypothetical protein